MSGDVKEELKHICISKIAVAGNTLARNGSIETGSTYPDEPFEVEISKTDFNEDPEDYHRIMIILTRIARRKATELLKSKNG